MNDLIERQAAIDVLNVGAELLKRVLDDADVVGVEREKYEWGLGLIESYISDMKELPSTQPETSLMTVTVAPDSEEIERVFRRIKDAPVMVLPSAQPQRWIPCSERLPEEKDAGILKKVGIEKRSEYVLATVEVKGERMTVTACTYDDKWDWNMKYAFPDYKVVAWMPLPEPYREEDGK